jgi:hypothetical protein
MRLRNKTELTTGGNSGIGLATARILHPLRKRIESESRNDPLHVQPCAQASAARLAFWPPSIPAVRRRISAGLPVSTARALNRDHKSICARKTLGRPRPALKKKGDAATFCALGGLGMKAIKRLHFQCSGDSRSIVFRFRVRE